MHTPKTVSYTHLANPEVNQDAIKLEVAPKVAVYTPEFDHTGARIQPWDDAVMPVSYTHLDVYKRQALLRGVFPETRNN